MKLQKFFEEIVKENESKELKRTQKNWKMIQIFFTQERFRKKAKLKKQNVLFKNWEKQNQNHERWKIFSKFVESKMCYLKI